MLFCCVCHFMLILSITSLNNCSGNVASLCCCFHLSRALSCWALRSLFPLILHIFQSFPALGPIPVFPSLRRTFWPGSITWSPTPNFSWIFGCKSNRSLFTRPLRKNSLRGGWPRRPLDELSIHWSQKRRFWYIRIFTKSPHSVPERKWWYSDFIHLLYKILNMSLLSYFFFRMSMP
jgi:hypothetical protein